MTQRYELTVNGKKSVVELCGINLQRASTSHYLVRIDGRKELVTKNHAEAVKYIAELPE